MSETRTPRWVWGVIAGLVLVDPACHLWIYFRPPAGTVATGLHTFDSIVYLMAMRMLDTDFFNPFASCQSPLGTHGIAYYATPWFWLYALPGRLATLIGMPHFLMLSVMDSLGAAAYLYAVWRFLRTVFPSHARIAFLIWSLGGGIGGAVFAITGALGLWHWPGAEDQLLRFVMYDLVEGANVSPTTHFQRLYYTLSLAILFTAFTELAQAMRGRCGKRLAWSAFLLALGSLLHPRYGPMMVMIMGLYVLWQTDMAFAQRFRYACAMALAGAVGAGASMAIMRQAPGYVNNALILCRVATWPSPLVSAAFFHVFTVPLQIGRIARRMPFLARAIVCALGGYLVAYAPLYFGYQVYWGNLLAGREARVADVMSDWALFGALAGLVYARVRRPKTQDKALPELGWVACAYVSCADPRRVWARVVVARDAAAHVGVAGFAALHLDRRAVDVVARIASAVGARVHPCDGRVRRVVDRHGGAVHSRAAVPCAGQGSVRAVARGDHGPSRCALDGRDGPGRGARSARRRPDDGRCRRLAPWHVRRIRHGHDELLGAGFPDGRARYGALFLAEWNGGSARGADPELVRDVCLLSRHASRRSARAGRAPGMAHARTDCGGEGRGGVSRQGRRMRSGRRNA